MRKQVYDYNHIYIFILISSPAETCLRQTPFQLHESFVKETKPYALDNQRFLAWSEVQRQPFCRPLSLYTEQKLPYMLL